MVIYLKCKDTILNSEFRNKNLEVWNTDFRNLRNSNNFFTEQQRDFMILIALNRGKQRRFAFLLCEKTLLPKLRDLRLNLLTT
jgi:hypothetical protein